MFILFDIMCICSKYTNKKSLLKNDYSGWIINGKYSY